MHVLKTLTAGAALTAGALLAASTLAASTLPAAAQQAQPSAVAPLARPAAVTPGVVTSSCTPTKISYKVSRAQSQTSSTSWETLPFAGVGFHQGGGSASCVIISFSAEAQAASRDYILVQPILDNTTVCIPNENAFSTSPEPTGLADRSMNFVCASVAPGNHTINMQWRTVHGGTATIFYRTLLVHYVP
ncbi:MAG: hypothetical protein ACRECC_00930 [Pseudolabrys sp.]